MHVQIKNGYKLTRDLDSMAVISTDTYGYSQARKAKEMRKELLDRMAKLEKILNFQDINIEG